MLISFTALTVSQLLTVTVTVASISQQKERCRRKLKI